MDTKGNLTVDCVRPATLAAFWEAALGYVEAPPTEGFGSWQDWLRHFEVPEDEWDDCAYLADPEGNEFCVL